MVRCEMRRSNCPQVPLLGVSDQKTLKGLLEMHVATYSRHLAVLMDVVSIARKQICGRGTQGAKGIPLCKLGIPTIDVVQSATVQEVQCHIILAFGQSVAFKEKNNTIQSHAESALCPLVPIYIKDSSQS